MSMIASLASMSMTIGYTPAATSTAASTPTFSHSVSRLVSRLRPPHCSMAVRNLKTSRSFEPEMSTFSEVGCMSGSVANPMKGRGGQAG